MDLSGITYKNTYYLLPHVSNINRLHFHELVHVAQWETLGASSFIGRYILEIQRNGYSQAPLEVMAYSLDNHFANETLGDVHYFITSNILRLLWLSLLEQWILMKQFMIL